MKEIVNVWHKCCDKERQELRKPFKKHFSIEMGT